MIESYYGGVYCEYRNKWVVLKHLLSLTLQRQYYYSTKLLSNSSKVDESMKVLSKDSVTILYLLGGEIGRAHV